LSNFSTLPFKTADIHFTLRSEDATTVVTVAPGYELKFGPLGRLLDAVYVRRDYESGMNDLLKGLKQYVEDAG
jgi:hypothetical protein